MTTVSNGRTVSLNIDRPIWDRFFTVAPLVVIGTREGDAYDLAPKHLALPMGWENYFGFVCSPRHSTYHNAQRSGAFTVSFPRPSQVVLTSMTAARRCDEEGGVRQKLEALPTVPATTVDGLFLADAYAFLECETEQIIDGFGPNSLIVGRVVAAHVDAEALRTSDESDASLVEHAPLLAYVAPGRYAAIEQSHAFPFPADFAR
jgi:flavin reductase (DIM6/NTAB) family NADH-FMN oxidoreductase RutF